jgi:hypothetical protein
LSLVLTLPEARREAWSLVEADVLAGNNISDAHVQFDPERFELSAEPRSTDA